MKSLCLKGSLLGLVVTQGLALADTKMPINTWLRRYGDTDQSFAKVMDEPLVKRLVEEGPAGEKPSERSSRDKNLVRGKRVNLEKVLEAKKAEREKLKLLVEERDERGRVTKKHTVTTTQIRSGRAPIQYGDEPWRLMSPGEKLYTNLFEMEKANLSAGEVAVQPWSDDYWGIYRGQLGARYGDPVFRNVSGDRWKPYHDVVKATPAIDLLMKGSSEGGRATDRLSPSEKYDLLVGDRNMTLTNRQWEAPRGYSPSGGTVETWMGICHGWAPAAYMFDRPVKGVEVNSVIDGKPIYFYPADVKALASYIWATVAPPARFVGGRCNDKDPRKNAAGRILSQECFDTNPGSWHQAVVSKVGAAKRSFVIDATFDYEVWNHPLKSYKISYFNPQTMQSGPLSSSIVPVQSFTKDRFPGLRGNAAKVVGVVMDIVYVVETHPTLLDTDAEYRDGLTSMRLTYDLELDDRGNIIGGEWYTNAHPDFLWTFDPEQQAATSYESAARGEWTGSTPPATWTMAAQRASASQSAPLLKVVAELVRRTSGKEAPRRPRHQAGPSSFGGNPGR